MATYGNQNTDTQATREPRTDYSKLIHNGKQYDNLDAMATQIAKERAHIAFKSTNMILAQLKVKKTEQEIATAMVEANKQMILDYVKNKDDSRSLFGL